MINIETLIKKHRLPEDCSTLLVFVDGKFTLHLSDKSAFISINSEENGYIIHLPKNTIATNLIQIIFFNTSESSQQNIELNNTVTTSDFSKITLVEELIDITKNSSLTTINTKLLAQKNSEINYYSLQKNHHLSKCTNNLFIEQEEQSTVNTRHYIHGTQCSTNNIHIKLLQEKARYHALGLCLLKQAQKSSFRVIAEHLAAKCQSNLLFKNIAADNAIINFSGRIIVHENTTQSETHLTNKNLLLSSQATINTKPELEIYNDDVICTHGATVGQLDQAALFYLQTRGFSEDAAKKILLDGFTQEIIIEFNELVQHQLSTSL